MKYFSKIKNFAIECRRVLKITKKPTTSEFKTIVKITAIGILVLGFIGFLVNMIDAFI